MDTLSEIGEQDVQKEILLETPGSSVEIKGSSVKDEPVVLKMGSRVFHFEYAPPVDGKRKWIVRDVAPQPNAEFTSDNIQVGRLTPFGRFSFLNDGEKGDEYLSRLQFSAFASPDGFLTFIHQGMRPTRILPPRGSKPTIIEVPKRAS